MNSNSVKIEDIDKNFKVESTICEPDIVWLDAKDAPFSIHGVTFDEKQGLFVRMPQEIAENVNSGVAYLYQHTAGGRVRFRTNSSYIAVKLEYNGKNSFAHITVLGQRGADIYRSENGQSVYYESIMPNITVFDSCCKGFSTDGKEYDYTINLPPYSPVSNIYIGLKKDAQIAPATPYKDIAPILYYGSSITQGACASRPGNSYQYMICKKTDVDYINLGFAGNAKAEDLMIDYLCSFDPSIFVCDYDHNAPNLEHLEKTHMKLFRKMREAHPTLPIIFMTAPVSPKSRNDWWKKRRDHIYNNYLTAKNEGDNNVYFVDGQKFFDGEFWSECTVDGVHPNDLGFSYMYKALLPVINKILEN